jgi:hypothetical protein
MWSSHGSDCSSVGWVSVFKEELDPELLDDNFLLKIKAGSLFIFYFIYLQWFVVSTF